MGELGDEAFAAAWREGLPDEEPPLTALREVLAQLRGSEEEEG